MGKSEVGIRIIAVGPEILESQARVVGRTWSDGGSRGRERSIFWYCGDRLVTTHTTGPLWHGYGGTIPISSQLKQEKRHPLQWRHNGPDGVSSHRRIDCLLQPFVQAQINENIKAPRHWLLWGEFTADRWIPLTKGQWRGKCFHLMTSSCMVRKSWDKVMTW